MNKTKIWMTGLVTWAALCAFTANAWVPVEKALDFAGGVAGVQTLGIMTAAAAPRSPALRVAIGCTGMSPTDVVYLRFQNLGAQPCSITRVAVEGPNVAGLHVYYQDPKVRFAVEPATADSDESAARAKKPFSGDGVDCGETLVLIVIPTGDTQPWQLWEDLVYGENEVRIEVLSGNLKKRPTKNVLTAIPEIPAS